MQGRESRQVDVKTMGKITLEGLDTVQTLYLSTGTPEPRAGLESAQCQSMPQFASP